MLKKKQIFNEKTDKEADVNDKLNQDEDIREQYEMQYNYIYLKKI